MSLFSLAGKRALVTGAARGIGFAIAEGLSTRGRQRHSERPHASRA